jgi:putative phage-type endonuclease
VKIYKDITQGTEEWAAIRKGRPTASRFSEIITPGGAPSKSSWAYTRELIAECFCPDWQAWTGNIYTDRGVQLEPEAREAFTKHTGLAVEQVGFIIGDDGVCGCSPDSLIMHGDKPVAGLEIKCPIPKTHVGYVLDGELPSEYVQQVHGSMAVTGLNQWHFFSYFPGMRPFHIIAKRDDYTAKMEVAIHEFVQKYKAATAQALPKLKL